MAAHAKPNHDYHLVNPSPWPFVGSISAFVMAIGAILWFHDIVTAVGAASSASPACSTPCTPGGRTSSRKPRQGDHTPVVQMHHRYGMMLFIASEVMFFVAWFWAYFDGFFRHRRRRAVSPASPRPAASGRRPASSCSTPSTCRCSTR